MDRRTVFIGGLLFFTAGLIVVGAVYLTVRLGPIILLVILSWILASGLAPYVGRLQQRGLRRPQAVGVVFVALLVFVIGVGLLVGIPASRQISRFLEDSNAYLYQMRVGWERIQGQADWLPDLTGIVDRLLAYVKERTRDEPGLARLGLDVLRGFGGLVSVLAVTLYMLLYPPRMERVADLLAPEDRSTRLRAAFSAVSHKFQRWLRAQFILSLTIGLMTFVGLLLLGVPYPHFLALVSAVGELIPVAGPFLAAVPAVFVALAHSPEKALAVAGLALFIQAFENYFLVPKVMRDVVGIPPLVTITGLLIGYELLGVAGAILVLPAAAALGILIPEVIGALAAPTPLSQAGESPQEPQVERAAARKSAPRR